MIKAPSTEPRPRTARTASDDAPPSTASTAVTGGARPARPHVPATPATTPTPRRRRPTLVAAGVVLVLVAGLASYSTMTAVSNTVAVVVAIGHIAKGEVLEAGDLGSIEIAGGQTTSAVPVAQAASLVGQHASVDLPPGALITSSSVQTSLPIEAGHSVVGLSVSTAQVPATPLRAGDRIRIVSTPLAQGEPPVEAPQTQAAIVFGVRDDERNGGYVVDVVVPSTIAPAIAARAATGRIAIVLDGA